MAGGGGFQRRAGVGAPAEAHPLEPSAVVIEIIAGVIVLLTAGLVLMSPNYAWYFLALVPFIPLGAGVPAWALTLGAFLLYRPFFFAQGNDLIWKSLATLPFLIALAFVLARRTQWEPPRAV